ncbi:MAG: ribosome maturation factor RimP [Desulfobacterales bacterium]
MLKRKKKSTRKKKTRPAQKQDVPVNSDALLSRVWVLAEPVCEYGGMELVHVEYQRAVSGNVLRLYIDRPGGVTLDDCAQISRQVSDLLDVEADDIGTYGLEVSSPGLNRLLSKETDFQRFKGRLAKVRTIGTIDGQKSFRGILSGISDHRVTLSVEGETVAIPFQEIKKARLIDNDGE